MSQTTADKETGPKLVVSCGSGRDSEETLHKLLVADHIAALRSLSLALFDGLASPLGTCRR